MKNVIFRAVWAGRLREDRGEEGGNGGGVYAVGSREGAQAQEVAVVQEEAAATLAPVSPRPAHL